MGATTCFAETSELTGAEQVCAARAATPQVGQQFLRTWNAYNDFINANKTDDLSDSQPTKGNILGGLTTIEEKAFGNLQKIGRRAKFIDVLKPAEAPRKGRASTTWTRRRRRQNASRCRPRPVSSCTCSQPGRATSSATRSSR
jgi:altronate dehydratase